MKIHSRVFTISILPPFSTKESWVSINKNIPFVPAGFQPSTIPVLLSQSITLICLLELEQKGNFICSQ